MLAERWRVHYNTLRPHSSLGYRSPAPETWLTNNMGMEKWKPLRASHFSTPSFSTLSTAATLSQKSLRYAKSSNGTEDRAPNSTRVTTYEETAVQGHTILRMVVTAVFAWWILSSMELDLDDEIAFLQSNDFSDQVKLFGSFGKAVVDIIGNMPVGGWSNLNRQQTVALKSAVKEARSVYNGLSGSSVDRKGFMLALSLGIASYWTGVAMTKRTMVMLMSDDDSELTAAPKPARKTKVSKK